MKLAIISCLVGVAIADLRQASQPKGGYDLLQQNSGRGTVDFAVGTGVTAQGTVNTQQEGQVLYIEPCTFGYQGLKNQRQNNYDNFLRSNIDNEQDNRNFDNEAGLDHLPFRTCEKDSPGEYPYTGNVLQGDDDDSLQNQQNVQTIIRTAPGEPRLTPLRWNNPHASEIEVNLWIMCADPPTVVPVKKPTCSGEGNQNNILEWAIPSDFNNVAWGACASTAPCFNGCNQLGDCMLQIYAHSVETRQYSTAVPIIVTGTPLTGPNTLPYDAIPIDAAEAAAFDWNSDFDLESMVKGTAPGNPGSQNGGVGVPIGPATNFDYIKICASSQREGINANGDSVAYQELTAQGTIYPQLNAGTVHLYICKNNEQQIAAEDTLDQVTFVVSTCDATATTCTAGPAQIENYPPFEVSSTDQFGGESIKKVTATLVTKTGVTQVLESYLDLRGNGKRWRFRRHLQNACPTGLEAPFPDPWLDLSQLKRVTCMSSQDPNSNYATTILKEAILHSDVANHAYQNSDYSPYSGQQQAEISRNMQAASVIHMASGNRGELGKAAVPADVAAQIAQLNNKVNTIYQNYEKVANKVIDALTNAGQVSGGATQMGVQQLADTFRGNEKGATSSKRLKTTTYVPSFNVAGYDMNIIQNAIASETGGNLASYADLLSPPNPQTGAQYIRIYRATFDRVLEDIKQLESTGYGFQESVKAVPCSSLGADLQAKSRVTGNTANQPATACCDGPITERGPGKCGSTLADLTQFRKRNAQGNKDGGVYAATRFYQQQMEAQYDCPTACQTVAVDTNQNLMAPLVKTAVGTCVTAIAGSLGCVVLETATAQTLAGATDCTGCIGRFNNVAPQTFRNDFAIGISQPGGGLTLDMINRVASDAARPLELPGSARNTPGDPLATDDTAVCHTESTFSCPGEDSEYDAMVNAGRCSGTDSVKIDNMCEDGPCDSNPDSMVCQMAKNRCEVDPETGVKCMPNSENNPCACTPFVDAGKVAAVASASLFVLAAAF